MALRASGHGMRARIIQFIKNDPSPGEVQAIRHLPGVELVQTGCGFVPPVAGPAFAVHREAAEKGLALAAETIASGNHDLVVLDEICTAVACRLLDEKAVLDTVQSAGSGTCLVLTGRGATDALREIADTVTELFCVKHDLEKNIPAG